MQHGGRAAWGRCGGARSAHKSDGWLCPRCLCMVISHVFSFCDGLISARESELSCSHCHHFPSSPHHPGPHLNPPSPPMTCSSTVSATPLPPQPGTRKRTMSFSTPAPRKAARTGLQRTGSYLSLEDMQVSVTTSLYGRGGHSSSSSSSQSERVSNGPHVRTSRHKGERDRRKSTQRPTPPPAKTPSLLQPTPPPVSTPLPPFRHSPPLASKPSIMPPRTCFPRSKPEPDLYRVAITTRMRMSPEGRKILYMGPRLALSMYTANRELERSLQMATNDLERIVASQREVDGDIVMTEDVGQPWVVLPQEDWEMVDCAA